VFQREYRWYVWSEQGQLELLVSDSSHMRSVHTCGLVLVENLVDLGLDFVDNARHDVML
jgi:hypothetical protein